MEVKFKPCLSPKTIDKLSEELQKTMNMKFKKDFLHLECGKCGELIGRNVNEILPCFIDKVTEYNIFIQIEHNLFHCKQKKNGN